MHILTLSLLLQPSLHCLLRSAGCLTRLWQACFVVTSIIVVQLSVFIINQADHQHVLHLLTLQSLPVF